MSVDTYVREGRHVRMCPIFCPKENLVLFEENFIFLRKKKHFLSDKILALPKDDEIVLPEKVERHLDLFVNRITPDFVLLSHLEISG